MFSPGQKRFGQTADVDGRAPPDRHDKTMAFGVAYLVSFFSSSMSLHPGDLISGAPRMME